MQATAERVPFDRDQLDELLDLAAAGIEEIGPPSRTRSRRLVPELFDRGRSSALLVAGVLGGAIGVEREIREREAGLRTHMLVAVGAALFTLVSAYGLRDFTSRTRAAVTLRPDADRGADRDRDRLPRGGRDHPSGALGSRA